MELYCANYSACRPAVLCFLWEGRVWDLGLKDVDCLIYRVWAWGAFKLRGLRTQGCGV